MDQDTAGPIRLDYVPASYFHKDDIPALEKAKLWPKTWHLACREEEIPKVGDFVNYEIFDESILVVRTKPDQIKGFYNVCQHRGRRLRDEERGNVSPGFYCKFHGWRYSLNGNVTHVYARENWDGCADFHEGDLSLKETKVGTWAGWVWINMDPNAEPLLDYLDAIVGRLKNFEIEKMRLAWYETIIAPVNWKVVVEAFNEGYHSGATHNTALDYKPMDSPGHVHGRHSMYYTMFPGLPAAKQNGEWAKLGTLQDLLYYQSKEIHETLFSLVMDPLMAAMTRMRAETKADASPEEIFAKLWDLHKEELKKAGLRWPEKLTPQELGNAGTGWHIFPNSVMLPAVDGVLWYRMRPYGEDPDKCIFDIWCLRPYEPGTEPKITRHISHGFEQFKGRNGFLEQDFDNMVATNKGIQSRGFLGAVCNPRQEVQISHFHKMLHDYMYGESAATKGKSSVTALSKKKTDKRKSKSAARKVGAPAVARRRRAR
jgi:phenylpropionate dioxygenase-like ring-hydroxylating dioxygenase large terminal subunit